MILSRSLVLTTTFCLISQTKPGATGKGEQVGSNSGGEGQLLLWMCLKHAEGPLPAGRGPRSGKQEGRPTALGEGGMRNLTKLR